MSELLSLKVEDVAENGITRSEITLSRLNLKGGRGARRRSVQNQRIARQAVFSTTVSSERV